jgi:hypothetical protein
MPTPSWLQLCGRWLADPRTVAGVIATPLRVAFQGQAWLKHQTGRRVLAHGRLLQGTVRRVWVTIGETFAGYTILRRLGSGGMAEVYLAQHPRLPRHALKVMSEAITADTDFRERFHREADLAATLWHPTYRRRA